MNQPAGPAAVPDPILPTVPAVGLGGPDRAGVLYAVLAYGIWGLAPIYFKAVGFASALEIVAHRIVWSVALLLLVLAMRSQLSALGRLRRHEVAWLALSGLLVAVNWAIFVGALQNDRMIEASLGYFINPLVNVVLGVLFFGEWFRPAQKLALLLAAVGVLNEVLGVGVVPWMGLSLALTFGCYGLVRKRLGVDSAIGLTVETLLMLPLAIGYFVVSGVNGGNAFLHSDAVAATLLAGAGLVTVVPLVSFAAAASRLPLSTLGLFQYLAPTMTLLLAVLVYDEPFQSRQYLTFGCIWIALVIFSGEALYHQRRIIRKS